MWPKKGSITDIEVLEDDYLDKALVSILQYERETEIALNRYAKLKGLNVSRYLLYIQLQQLNSSFLLQP